MSLHVRIGEELEETLKERAYDLGFENLSQYIRDVLRKEAKRECKCPNGCNRELINNECPECGSLGV